MQATLGIKANALDIQDNSERYVQLKSEQILVSLESCPNVYFQSRGLVHGTTAIFNSVRIRLFS